MYAGGYLGETYYGGYASDEYEVTSVEQGQNYGFRVSLKGYDVLDPHIDPQNLIFSTEFSSPKVLTEGIGSVTIANGQYESNTWTLNHNYGVPLVYFIYYKAHVEAIDEDAYFLSPLNFSMVTGNQILGTSPPTDSNLYAEDMCDANNIKFKVKRAGTSGEQIVQFKYYVLLEPLIPFKGTLPTLNSDYGFKISKPDTDVYSDKETDIAFTSSRKFFKLKDIIRQAVGVPSVEYGVTDVRFAFPHNLGYFPAFWAFASSGDDIFDTPVSDTVEPATVMSAALSLKEAYVTKTHFYFRIIRAAGWGTNWGTPYLLSWGQELINFIYVVTHEKLS